MSLDIASMVISSAVSSVLAAVTSVVVLKVNQKWHKEKLDRHSTSFKNAFQEIADLRQDVATKHEQQQKDIHRLEVELYKRLGGDK